MVTDREMQLNFFLILFIVTRRHDDTMRQCNLISSNFVVCAALLPLHVISRHVKQAVRRFILQ